VDPDLNFSKVKLKTVQCGQMNTFESDASPLVLLDTIPCQKLRIRFYPNCTDSSEVEYGFEAGHGNLKRTGSGKNHVESTTLRKGLDAVLLCNFFYIPIK
jgi:hypothetical protein